MCICNSYSVFRVFVFSSLEANRPQMTRGIFHRGPPDDSEAGWKLGQASDEI